MEETIITKADNKEKNSKSLFKYWTPFLVVLIPTFFATFTWWKTEENKRLHEAFVRKEQRYAMLVKTLSGFYSNTYDVKKQNEFLDQTRLCWLYCPDDVIKEINAFLDVIKKGSGANKNEKDKAVGRLMIAIRNDIIKKTTLEKTTLSQKDFLFYNMPQNKQITEGKME